MHSLDLQVLHTAWQWRLQGHRVWLLTVMETWGSAPRQPGALAALRADGQLAGSVSGGCVEEDLMARVCRGEGVETLSFVRYGVSPEEAARFGLPCGGALRLLLEPLADVGWIDELLRCTAQHELVMRCLDLSTGKVTLEAGARGQAFMFNDQHLRAVFGPRWRLLIVGAGQISQAVAGMALTVDFGVVCCDPREEYQASWNVPGSVFSPAMPDDEAVAMTLDAHSAVLALTHDPRLDDMVLLEALKSPAFYIGALGSRGNTEKRRERLALFDLTAAQIDRLHGPVGLDLGGNTPGEMAVAIVAELIAVKNGVMLSQKKAGSWMPGRHSNYVPAE